MKHSRGLYQSDSMVDGQAIEMSEEGNATITSGKQNMSGHVAGRQRGLGRRFSRARLLPIFRLLFAAECSRICFWQSTFGSVRGIVQDNTSAAIPDTSSCCTAWIENSERTATTDDSGNFTFENVKAGTYSLRAHHDGFADTAITRDLSRGASGSCG